MELLVLLGLILLNGVFAASEMALVSARTARLEVRARDGNAGAKAALKLAEDPSLFLSTVQVGITTIGILSGAFGENAIARQLVGVYEALPLVAGHADALAIVTMVLIITYLSVVFGELVPKRLALLAPERFASTVARPMGRLAWVAYPVVTLFSRSGDLVLRLLRADRQAEPDVSDEELRSMMAQGTASGVFEAHEETMVGNVLRLDDLHVHAMMTPRSRIVWIDVDAPTIDQWATLRAARHQAYPVARGTVDGVLGILAVSEVFGHADERSAPALEPFIRPALLVPESVSPLGLLAQLRESRTHLALIVDEYGAVEGLVSRTDLLEAIVGDFPMPDEPADQEVVQRADGSWSLDGMLPADRAADLLGFQPLVDPAGGYHTLGGFVMRRLARIPEIGATFDERGLRFEVLDMDGYRVDRVLVTPVQDG